VLEILQQQFAASAIGRWYFGREAQERTIIATLSICVAIALLWLLVWKPIGDWSELEDNRYRNAQSLLDWMQANEARARTVAKSQQSGGGGQRSLLPTITGTAAAEGLTLSRLQPESNGAVSVVLQAQQFNAMVRWLDGLRENNGVTIQRVSVDAEGQPGYVNAQLRLQ
jgi:general secretion pathway protein M